MQSIPSRLKPHASCLAAIALAFAARAHALDNHDTMLLAEPAISEKNIAFVYDSDLWIANRDGSDARRLTTAGGRESHPVFSRDGASIAFSANYDGNVDVYLMPIAGGTPQRLTWHSSPDWMESFDDKGRVIFSSESDAHGDREIHLFAIKPGQGLPELLPIPLGNDADVSANGKQIAYSIMQPEMHTALLQWKGYRGGSASRVAVMNFSDYGITKVPQPAGRCNDLNPMWVNGKLYFLSDRNGEFNLYRYDADSQAVTQLTFHNDFPVVNASGGGGAIIYEQAGHLRTFDPATGNESTLHVATNSDLRETRPRTVSNPDYVHGVSGDPSFDRVALEYRGEIVTVPAKKGAAVRNLTQSPGANDRRPAWSPKGGQIAWFSDLDGEYALYVGDAEGSKPARKIAIEGGAGTYQDLKWSPDEAHVSFLDNAYALFVADIASGKTRRIATNDYFGHQPYISHNWSADSRWLAYTENAHGLIQTVHVYSLEQSKSFQITDGLAEVSEPVFDKNGQFLYVLATDQAGPIKDWFSQSSLDFGYTSSLYAIVLRRDGESPLPIEGKDVPTSVSGARVTIDFDGIQDRVVALPTGEKTLRNLQAGKSGELFYLSSPATSILTSLSAPAELKRFTLRDRDAKTVAAGVEAYFVSNDGQKLLLQQGRRWRTAPIETPLKTESYTQVPVEDVSVYIDPRLEWRQIAREAWRINRDYFYDPHFHGADWDAVWKKYEPFLNEAATRADVGRIVAAIASELRVGHSYTTPGETISKAGELGIGLLGADYEISNGHYRFKKIYGGLNWRPELRAPLKTPGSLVNEGEYLLAVEGKPLSPSESVYAAFQNTVDKPVNITVGPNYDGKGARTIAVKPIGNERELRYVDWVEGNIRKVDTATNGRVAYVHVPDTSVEGHAAFKRYFYPQSHKDALIVDERDNGGGYFADYYMNVLRQQPAAEWATRYGKDLVTPRGAIFGPKVMISNSGAGSGGDLLPWMFRKFHLGTIVGTRTWGGLVGNLIIHPLMDGATITAPNFAGWTPEDGWIVENEGVPPDVEVEETPQTMRAGRDPQLEKAIEIALKQLAEHPPQRAAHPAYPVRVPK